MDFKRTKIVATLGPASVKPDVLSQIITEGVNVCRINFSHGSHEDHEIAIKNIRETSKKLNKNIAILADLQGPKLRIGEVKDNQVILEDGKIIKFTTEECIGDENQLYMNYQNFPNDVQQGELILIDDGKLHLEILETNGINEVKAKVIHGGVLSSKKGVNLPNTKISLPSLTKKDLIDLEFALNHDIDWIGLSFVRTARDIIELKHIIKDKRKHSKVIAKIEKPEALEDIDMIISETDALMVARGDLGVEVPMQKVPLLQKELVHKCREAAKPVIIATQMMESMITNISPTRAEVNDVANAVMDGADAVMLSGETSVGKFPVDVIKAMSKIIKEIEQFEGIYHHETFPEEGTNERFITDSVCYNAVRLAQRVEAKAIITMTHSGYTAFKLSSQRPKARVIVFTSNKEALQVLSLVWGVTVFYYDKMLSTDHTISDVKYLLKKDDIVKQDDYIINTASMPIEENGMTNMLKLNKVD
jgi:pyruvate kinase